MAKQLSARITSENDRLGQFQHEKARVVARFERDYLERVLDNTGGNISAAARQAGKERRAFTRPHAEALLMAPDLNTFQGVRDAAMFALLMGCGLRVSGVCALNDSSLIWARDEHRDEILILRALEKGDKERLVPVPTEGRFLLRAYLGHEDLEEIDRTLPNGDRVLFVTQKARIPSYEYHGERRRMLRQGVHKRIQKHAKEAGIPMDLAHPHALRHLFGTELAEDEVDLLRIQSLMGHASPKTTEVYVHLAVRHLAKVIEASSPLKKIETPVSGLVREYQK